MRNLTIRQVGEIVAFIENQWIMPTSLVRFVKNRELIHRVRSQKEPTMTDDKTPEKTIPVVLPVLPLRNIVVFQA